MSLMGRERMWETIASIPRNHLAVALKGIDMDRHKNKWPSLVSWKPTKRRISVMTIIAPCC